MNCPACKNYIDGLCEYPNYGKCKSDLLEDEILEWKAYLRNTCAKEIMQKCLNCDQKHICQMENTFVREISNCKDTVEENTETSVKEDEYKFRICDILGVEIGEIFKVKDSLEIYCIDKTGTIKIVDPMMYSEIDSTKYLSFIGTPSSALLCNLINNRGLIVKLSWAK